MKLKKIVKGIAVAALMLTGVQTSNAQDMLARQAPVDRKMKAVDTLALKNLIEREQAITPGSDLYAGWDNKYAHKQTQLPDSFRINMRNFCMPTPSRVITSNFGPRWGRMHKGIDVKVYIGDTIRAAFSGKVRIVRYEASGYGNYVVIRHNNGLETIYGHLSKHLCSENQTVKAGDVIGLGGNTGRSTGSHLHFETRICGVALNPALLFDFRNQDVTCDSYLFRRADYERANGKATAKMKLKNDDKKDVAQAEKKADEKVNAKRNADDKPEIVKSESQKNAEKKSSSKKESDKYVADNRKSNDKKSNDKKSAESKSKKDDKKSKAKEVAKNSKKKQSSEHTVKQGETLTSIAHRNGMSVDELCRKNGIKKDGVLSIGKKLRVS